MSNGAGKTIYLQGHRVRYWARFSQTAKKRRIKVNSKGVEVILPGHVSEDRAAVFLQENSAWVLSQLAFIRRMGTLRSKSVLPPRNSILFRGKPLAIGVIKEKSNRNFGIVEHSNKRLLIRVPAYKPIGPSKTLESWLRRQARLKIETRLAERSREMRRKPGRIYIMDQQTKWGGCSRRGNLSFNWRLIMAPPEVLDYIVVHEIAHLNEPFHSTRFWLIVRSFCPDFERHKAWLRDHQDQLRAKFALPQYSGVDQD
jgi:predicted metal-dependent hydrolase